MKKVSHAWLTLNNFFMLLLCAAPGCIPLLRTRTQTWGGLMTGLVDFACFGIGALSVAVGITGICDTIQKKRTARLDGEKMQDRWLFLSIAMLLVLNGFVGALVPIATAPPLVGLILSAILTFIGIYVIVTPSRQPE